MPPLSVVCRVVAISDDSGEIIEEIGTQGFVSLPRRGDRIHYEMREDVDVVEVIRVDHYPVDYSNTGKRSNIFGNDQPAATVYCRFFAPRTGTDG